MIISSWILLRIRNVADTNCGENQNTRLMFNSFFPEIVLFMGQCGKTWYGQTDNIWRMRFACWIPKAANTNSFAFTRQLWLCECPSLSRFTYTVGHVHIYSLSQSSTRYVCTDKTRTTHIKTPAERTAQGITGRTSNSVIRIHSRNKEW